MKNKSVYTNKPRRNSSPLQGDLTIKRWANRYKRWDRRREEALEVKYGRGLLRDLLAFLRSPLAFLKRRKKRRRELLRKRKIRRHKKYNRYFV